RVGPELTGAGEAERVGTPARDVALLAGDAVARAHDAARERTAGAVVVAHLDRALEAAAAAGIGRPVELRRHLVSMVAGRIAEKLAVVELGRAHDLAGIEQALGIEPVLDLLERVHEPRPEH